MTDQALDSMLRRVLLDVDCQQYGEAIDELPECDFSPAFEKKMQKLIRRADHPIRYRVAQAVACLLLAVLLSGCTVLAISPEAREAFVGWVREVYEMCFVYHFTGEGQVSPENAVYCPTWVPDGYELITEPKEEKISTAIYANTKDDTIAFVCCRVSESTTIQVGRDGHEISQSVFVGDIPADLYIDQDENEASILVWWDEMKGLLFEISAPLTGEELIKIAESVEAVQ